MELDRNATTRIIERKRSPVNRNPAERKGFKSGKWQWFQDGIFAFAMNGVDFFPDCK